jgi:hypothetical protein
MEAIRTYRCPTGSVCSLIPLNEHAWITTEAMINLSLSLPLKQNRSL